MNTTPNPTSSFPSPDPISERRRALLDRQLERLDQLVDAGMGMVEGLAAQARGAGPRVVEGDLVLAYSRAARAVRMAILLQSHLVSEPEAKHDARAEPEAETALAEWAATDEERAEPAAPDDAGRERDPDEFTERPACERAERLERDDIYRAVQTRPVHELVAEIANDLGLSPDWPELPPEPGAKGDPLEAYFTRPPPRAGEVTAEGAFRCDTG